MMSAQHTHIAPNTQNQLLLTNLTEFYSVGEKENLLKMMRIINGESNISLRILDWFVTNYSKKYFTVYDLETTDLVNEEDVVRFKVYNEYKLKLKAYRKRRFDPFCRWERIRIPYNAENYIETTIGQLNFFKWAIENRILEYITANFKTIESDMNARNRVQKSNKTQSISAASSSGSLTDDTAQGSGTNSSSNTKTRKKREELSVSACKCIKKENVKIVVKF